MKLYYKPGACSLSPHIVAHELGLDIEAEQVDLMKKVTASGADYLQINPKGQVPALVLDNGELLTEGPAIVQYLADQAGKLIPAAGTLARYHMIEALNYISTELHKGFTPLFAALFGKREEGVGEQVCRDRLKQNLTLTNQKLSQQDYFCGAEFSVADAYLFTVLNWAKYVRIDIADYPALPAYLARIAERPGVQAALKAEGLLG
ncbi:glutathione transferase GstA [Pokkaliibacter sp. MBI-7]|uniref:glutathione transferase GstA n=1 Tax=Pokkaliibacter sp. MBI-7 TaxID=3040600 RepID=UPI002446D233|nr:glutathione transferase GstA [Pokkaliibacter sp. MBI-7]MDH2432396.1 glutathione transferase GstA [Pokkaliibacter sp. MBI-7]